MIDQRGLAWTRLLPRTATYQLIGAPDEVAAALSPSAGVASILVSWCQSAEETPDLDRCAAFVAVNGEPPALALLRDRGFSHIRRYAVVPGLSDPRWYIPLDLPAVAAAAFQLYTPYRATARIKRNLVRAAARSGLPGWYRDRIVIAQRTPPPLEQVIADILPNEAVWLALSSGTAGPARKATVAILNRQGQALGFAKCAESPLSERLVRNEAATLASLAALPATASLVPRLLFAGDIDGSFTAIQQTVMGAQAPRLMTATHQRFLETLMIGRAKPATTTDLVSSLRSRLWALPPAQHQLAAIVDAVWPVLDRIDLPATIVHGDFAPWNLRIESGRMVAIDWEYGVMDGLPLVDAIHHLLQVGFLVEGWSVAKACDRLAAHASSGELGLTTEQMRALQIVSLLDKLARRYEEEYLANDPTSLWYQRIIESVTADRSVRAA
jgi:hypothetical protein